VKITREAVETWLDDWDTGYEAARAAANSEMVALAKDVVPRLIDMSGALDNGRTLKHAGDDAALDAVAWVGLLTAVCIFTEPIVLMLAPSFWLLPILTTLALLGLLSRVRRWDEIRKPVLAARKRRRRAAEAWLREVDHPSCLGPLLEHTGWTNRGGDQTDVGIPDLLLPALRRLLSTTRDYQHAGLTEAQRRKLYALLDLYYALKNPDVLTAALGLIVRSEDADALSIVRHVAGSAVASPNSQRVKDAARQALPALEAAAARRRSGETLLRAADSPADSSTLLRPAASSTHDTDQLLRASVSNPNPLDQ
jgi:hypothetical protein